jgi:hypothetical protein
MLGQQQQHTDCDRQAMSGSYACYRPIIGGVTSDRPSILLVTATHADQGHMTDLITEYIPNVRLSVAKLGDIQLTNSVISPYNAVCCACDVMSCLRLLIQHGDPVVYSRIFCYDEGSQGPITQSNVECVPMLYTNYWFPLSGGTRIRGKCLNVVVACIKHLLEQPIDRTPAHTVLTHIYT